MRLIYAILVLAILCMYALHPVRPTQFRNAHERWRVIVEVGWGIDLPEFLEKD